MLGSLFRSPITAGSAATLLAVAGGFPKHPKIRMRMISSLRGGPGSRQRATLTPWGAWWCPLLLRVIAAGQRRGSGVGRDSVSSQRAASSVLVGGQITLCVTGCPTSSTLGRGVWGLPTAGGVLGVPLHPGAAGLNILPSQERPSSLKPRGCSWGGWGEALPSRPAAGTLL